MNSQVPQAVSTDKLDLILNKLTAIERRLDILEQVKEVPGIIATAVDTSDAYLQAHPIDTQQVIPGVEKLIYKLAQPEVLEGLNQLVSVLPTVAQYTQSIEALPGVIATAGDSFDEVIQNLKAQGVDPLTLTPDLLGLLRTLTLPETLQALNQLTSILPQISPLLASAKDAPGIIATAVDSFDELYERFIVSNEALQKQLSQAQTIAGQVSADHLLDQTQTLINTLQKGKHQAEAVGPLGLVKSLRDQDIQRLLGYLLYVSKHMSKNILKR